MSFIVYCPHSVILGELFCPSTVLLRRCHGFLICLLCLPLQQLMRERQQMASRPFASVAVALEAVAECMDLMQPMVDVSPSVAHIRTQC